MDSKEDMKTLDEFRQAISKITSDKGTFNKLMDAYRVEDIDTCKEIFKEFDFRPPICHLMCQFVCWVERIVRCYRICRAICF